MPQALETRVLGESIKYYTLVLLLLLNAFKLSTQQGVDRTMVSEATDSDVARAVSNRVQAVFGDDRQFLRRIAFVESKDATDIDTYRPGYHRGMWQVDEDVFAITQDTVTHPGLVALHQQIFDNFAINWNTVDWTDLRIPLYSGLAARLFLSTIPEEIPCDIAGQATYWATHYNTDGNAESFIQDADSLSAFESK